MRSILKSIATAMPPFRRIVDERDAALLEVANLRAAQNVTGTGEPGEKDPYRRASYSWEGEDRIAEKLLAEFFGVATQGFYVDLGAHHPYLMSNTAIFHEKGWRGINVDATPGSMEPFARFRPQAVNLEVAVADTNGRRNFYTFAEPGLNGFLDPSSVQHHSNRGLPPLSNMEMECRTINSILSEFASADEIDLMSVDIEGLDEAVLRSLDARWLPKVLIAEILSHDGIAELIDSPIAKLLSQRGYTFFSRLHFSSIFIRR